MINIYDFCIYTAAVLPIVSTIAYLIVKYNDILYAYSLFLSAAGPIVLGLKLATTPNSILAAHLIPIAIIFLIYIITAIVLGIICISYCKKEKKLKKEVKLSLDSSN